MTLELNLTKFLMTLSLAIVKKQQKMQYDSILVSAEKVSAPIPKFNPGFGSRYRYRISVAH